MSRATAATLGLWSLVLLLAISPADAACAHAERGMRASQQYIELIAGDATAGAAIGEAATMWNGCPQTAAGGIPTVFAGSTPPGGYTPYTVYYHDGLAPTPGVCGHIGGNTIDIYQRTLITATNTVADCGRYGYGQTVAHEVGHIYGLGDNFDPSCQSEIMGQIGQPRAVQPDECSMADDMNRTYSDSHNGCWSLQDCHQSPLLLNLGSGPYRLTDLPGGVDFDIDGSGLPERVSWTAAGTEQGFLWLDRNGNGVVDGGVELFGDVAAANGFEALKSYDLPAEGGNGDGILDAHDAVWARLRVWIDYNHDGLSQPEEIFSLTEKGVLALGLAYRASGRVDSNGNLFRYEALVAVRQRGRTTILPYYDVYLLKR